MNAVGQSSCELVGRQGAGHRKSPVTRSQDFNWGRRKIGVDPDPIFGREGARSLGRGDGRHHRVVRNALGEEHVNGPLGGHRVVTAGVLSFARSALRADPVITVGYIKSVVESLVEDLLLTKREAVTQSSVKTFHAEHVRAVALPGEA